MLRLRMFGSPPKRFFHAASVRITERSSPGRKSRPSAGAGLHLQNGVDGRIDNPTIGWKGRGLWATYGSYTPWHFEGGKGETSKVVHFQLRPDPLSK